MSKSYGNAIYLTDNMDVVHRKTQSMSNGGQRPTQADPGDPEICPVGDLHRIFSIPEMDRQIREGCTTATIRCDECKFMLATSIFAKIQPIQVRRSELESKADTVWEVLENGSARARASAEVVMKEVRAVMGLSRDLSGIHIAKSLQPEEQAEDARNLSAYSDWTGLDPAVLTKNVGQLWRRQILPPEVALKPDSAEMWVTANNRRVCVAASYWEPHLMHWRFGVQPRSYEVLILLCLDENNQLHDFVIPQKLYLSTWVTEKKKVAGLLWLEIRRYEGLYLLRIGSSTESIDITATERNYAIL